jgi:hypothetical protein
MRNLNGKGTRSQFDVLDSSSANIVITSPGEDIKFHTLGSSKFTLDKNPGPKKFPKIRRLDQKPGLRNMHPEKIKFGANYLAGLPYKKISNPRNARSYDKIS